MSEATSKSFDFTKAGIVRVSGVWPAGESSVTVSGVRVTEQSIVAVSVQEQRSGDITGIVEDLSSRVTSGTSPSITLVPIDSTETPAQSINFEVFAMGVI